MEFTQYVHVIYLCMKKYIPGVYPECIWYLLVYRKKYMQFIQYVRGIFLCMKKYIPGVYSICTWYLLMYEKNRPSVYWVFTRG